MPCVLCGKEERGAAVEDIVCSVCFNQLASIPGRRVVQMIEEAERANQTKKAEMLLLLIGRKSYRSLRSLKLNRRKKR